MWSQPKGRGEGAAWKTASSLQHEVEVTAAKVSLDGTALECGAWAIDPLFAGIRAPGSSRLEGHHLPMCIPIWRPDYDALASVLDRCTVRVVSLINATKITSCKAFSSISLVESRSRSADKSRYLVITLCGFLNKCCII